MGTSPPCAETHPEPPTYPALWKEGPAKAGRRQKNLCPLSPLRPHRSRRVWYCCLQMEKLRHRRVQLRFGHSGLKVTGLSFLARVPQTLMFSLLVIPDALSWECCLSPKWLTILLPLQGPQLPRSLKSQSSSSGMGAESLPPGPEVARGPCCGCSTSLLELSAPHFSTSIPPLLLSSGLTDSSNLLHQALVSLWYPGCSLGRLWKSDREETRKGGTWFWMKVEL